MTFLKFKQQFLNKSALLGAALLMICRPMAVSADMSAWNYSSKVLINTTSSGAEVNGNVADFPLLVSLDMNNFNFSQAKSGGEDIRFTNAGGTDLPYEIELWDTAGNMAAIWVLVDNIAGNNPSQYIQMFWGNSSATDNSAPNEVFSTAKGYAGVWHMNEDPGAGKSSILDRTANAKHGSPSGMSSANSSEGQVGKAVNFQGSGDYIEFPALDTEYDSLIALPQI